MNNTAIQITEHTYQANNVVDFHSKLKEKAEKQQKLETDSYVLNNIIPYMSDEEHRALTFALNSDDHNATLKLWDKIIVNTAIRRAQSEN